MSVPGRGGIGVLTGEHHVGPWETLTGFSFTDGPLRPVHPRLWRLTGFNCPSLASLFSFWVQLQSTPFPNLLQGPNQPGLSLSKSLLYFWKYSALCVVFHQRKDQMHILMGFGSETSKGTGGRYKLFHYFPHCWTLTWSQLFTPEVASGSPSILRNKVTPFRDLKFPLFPLSFRRTQSSVWKPFCSLQKVI